MASILHSTVPVSHYHQSFSSLQSPPSSSATSLLYHTSFKEVSCFLTKNRRTHNLNFPKRNLVCQSVNDASKEVLNEVSKEVSKIEPPWVAAEKSEKAELIRALKLKLLSAVSGLNRGLVANEDDLRKADAAAKEVEAAGGIVDLPADLDKLQGRWRLIYSSAFSSRTLGGSRPGPPTGRLLPITLGQVFQRIDIFSKDFDNIVDLELGTPWPVPPIEVTATLAHKFKLEGSSRIRILFEKTTVKTTGNLSQLPPLEIPQLPDALRPPANRGTGEFEVTYLDSDTRITRGDRGELRVFLIA